MKTDPCMQACDPLGDARALVSDFLSHEQSSDAIPPMTLEQARNTPIGIPEFGLGEEAALERLKQLIDATPATSGARFANQLFAGRERVATAAEAAAAVLNTSMYTYKAAGPQVLIERVVIERMLEKAGMSGGGGMFAPGGSMSNLAAMIMARNELIPDARDAGVDGRPLRVYASAEQHYSVRKSAGMIGLGRSNVVSVDADRDGRMRPDALRERIRADRDAGLTPMMVIATSGTTVMGAFDPLDELADVCGPEKLWLHVDGAFGGTALLSEKTRPLLRGIERADSLTWDAHKAMGVPLTCSVVLTRTQGLTRRHFDESASYLFQQDFGEEHGWLNPGTRSLQCGRRNDALKLWAQWQALGDDGYAARVERQMSLAARAAELVRADPSMRLTHEPSWLTVCFEIEGKSSDAICAALNDTGELKVGHGIVHGTRVIRLVTVDPSLTEQDIERMIGDIARVAKSAPASDNRTES